MPFSKFLGMTRPGVKPRPSRVRSEHSANGPRTGVARVITGVKCARNVGYTTARLLFVVQLFFLMLRFLPHELSGTESRML